MFGLIPGEHVARIPEGKGLVAAFPYKYILLASAENGFSFLEPSRLLVQPFRAGRSDAKGFGWVWD